MKPLFLNCKQVVQIVSSEDSLHWRRNPKVRWHLFLCVHCRKYVQHLKLIADGFKNFFRTIANADEKQKISQIEAVAIAQINPKNSQ